MAKREDFKKRDDKPDDGITTKLVMLNRVSKTVKGGRNMRFAALVVAGDGKGKVGYGMCKAAEVSEAIKKAELAARKGMVSISLKGDTLPHETWGKFAKSCVLMLPAPEGTGVIAGGAVRAVVELAGVKNITTKSYGSRNPVNTVKAAFNGLVTLRTVEEVALLRDKTVEEVL